MKRLGLFTGKVYNDNCDLSIVKECCLLISDKQASDDAFIQREHAKYSKKCARCMGCPEAKKSVKKGVQKNG